MTSDHDEQPRTRTWRRQDAPPSTPEPPAGRIQIDVPPGPVPDADELAEAIRASLRGWPVVILRLVGKVTGKAITGNFKGRWLRGQIGLAIDASMPPDAANTLLGPHQPGTRIVGGAWAPIAVRASGLGDSRLDEGADVRAELVLSGRATTQAGLLVNALLQPNLDRAVEPIVIQWTTVQHLVVDEDGDPRWRTCKPGVRPGLVPMDRITEPGVRSTRLLMNFLTPAAIARRDETGEPWPDLPVVVDRIGRTLSTWLKRSKHKGPLLPDEDLLRYAAQATLSANHTRAVQIPANLVGAEPGPRRGPPTPGGDRVAALVGSATWTGEFAGLVPLLVAAAWVGMGPGRQNGLGEIAVR